MDPDGDPASSRAQADDAPVQFEAAGRLARPGALAAAARVRLDSASFEVSITGHGPLVADYRDITTLMPGPGTLLLVLGAGEGSVRIVLEQLGAHLGSLVGQFRERRTRQRLTDAFVQLGPDPLPVVEYRIGDEHAVAQLAVHPWGAALVPLDDTLTIRRIRRAEIGGVDVDPAGGIVRLALAGGDPGHPAVQDSQPTTLELPGLGPSATAWGERLTELRDGALRDAATLVSGLVPDAPFGSRQLLGRLLVDGRPASAAELSAELERVDAAVLTEPVFATSFRELAARGGSIRWFAMAPVRPGADERRAWYLVALPGNLLALELVSEGAHATYLFRAAPRATYAGQGPEAIVGEHATAAGEVSSALIDARFLREPMALPATQLATARFLRYRLALAALPSLAAARRRFVARLVHDDPVRWAAALDDLITWHSAVRDEAAEWPGRATEETAVGAAENEETTSDAGL